MIFNIKTTTQFDIKDIAKGLSLINVEGGDTFYSLAEHSVNLVNLMKSEDGKRIALLHEASKAYVYCNKVIKEYVTITGRIIEDVQYRIWRYFGLAEVNINVWEEFVNKHNKENETGLLRPEHAERLFLEVARSVGIRRGA